MLKPRPKLETLLEQGQPPSGGCVLKQQCIPVSSRPNVQPPSGGCVLKQSKKAWIARLNNQPPSGGCVLKPPNFENPEACDDQPPSGGCVLKLHKNDLCRREQGPAAFGRLRVETLYYFCATLVFHPAAFGRLRVETTKKRSVFISLPTSRLRAAAC